MLSVKTPAGTISSTAYVNVDADAARRWDELLADGRWGDSDWLSALANREIVSGQGRLQKIEAETSSRDADLLARAKAAFGSAAVLAATTSEETGDRFKIGNNDFTDAARGLAAAILAS